MDQLKFRATLAEEGFDEVELRTMTPNLCNGAHSHQFDVRALMVEGELTLGSEGRQQTYTAGEIFSMATGCHHTEQFGPQGATYLVGRRRTRA